MGSEKRTKFISVPENFLIGFDQPGLPDLIPAITYHHLGGLTPVPVSSTLLLLGSGLLGIMGLRKRESYRKNE